MAHILIAEDDKSVRTFVSRALSLRGHTVREAENGAAALRALSQEGGFDLVITDVVMPEMDGIALAVEVAHRHPEMPLLLMTGYSAERERAHNLDHLDCGVIIKPFSLSAICDAAETAIEDDSKAAVQPTGTGGNEGRPQYR